MNKDELRRLEMLNQLRLTEDQKNDIMCFFENRYKDLNEIEDINTESIERMVHVMPIMTVVRDDIVSHPFSREDLQKGAPETDEGYWCVPKVIE